VSDVSRASNGLSARHPFDRWFRYPAGFSRSALDLALGAVAVGLEGGVLVDPFAGTASVGTAAVAKGMTFLGLEAHPEIAELADLKFRRRATLSSMMDAAAGIVDSSVPGLRMRSRTSYSGALTPRRLLTWWASDRPSSSERLIRGQLT